jgi:hypothetical protein
MSQANVEILRRALASAPTDPEAEYRHGMATLQTGEMFAGLDDYASGSWRGAQ